MGGKNEATVVLAAGGTVPEALSAGARDGEAGELPCVYQAAAITAATTKNRTIEPWNLRLQRLGLGSGVGLDQPGTLPRDSWETRAFLASSQSRQASGIGRAASGA